MTKSNLKFLQFFLLFNSIESDNYKTEKTPVIENIKEKNSVADLKNQLQNLENQESSLKDQMQTLYTKPYIATRILLGVILTAQFFLIDKEENKDQEIKSYFVANLLFLAISYVLPYLNNNLNFYKGYYGIVGGLKCATALEVIIKNIKDWKTITCIMHCVLDCYLSYKWYKFYESKDKLKNIKKDMEVLKNTLRKIQ